MSRNLIVLLLPNVLLFSTAFAVNCRVTNFNDVAEAAKECGTLTIGDLVIPSKTTLNINLKDGATLIFDGHLTHEPAEWTGDLVQITGNKATVYGTGNHVLDGLGPKHWKGGNEETIMRPKFIRIKLKNSEVRDLYVKNCPNNCMMLSGTDHLTISNIHIDNLDGYPAKAGSKYAKNTDGFDVGSSTNLRVQNSVVYNQDDCVAVNGGSFMVFENLFCNGSHGLSFSVKNGDVHDIEFRNSHLEYAGTAIHIKTHPDGGTGSIRNVLYENITFVGITDYAVSIQENYGGTEAKANIPITNLTMKVVKGSMIGKKSVAINVICANNGCSDWHWSDVKGTGAAKKNVCQYAPDDIATKYCQ